MTSLPDTLLGLICHRSGLHSEVLPLCWRCSAVYAGVLLGTVAETLLRGWRQPSPGRAAVAINAVGLAAMASVGFGKLYGVLATPELLNVFVALYFGAAVAFFAVTASAHDLRRAAAEGRSRSIPVRVAVLLGLGLWSWALTRGWHSPMRCLGWAAVAGVVAAFFEVNFAAALVLVRRLQRRPLRVGLALALVPVLVGVELILFYAWRQVAGAGAR